MSKERNRRRSRRRKKGPARPMLLTAYNYKILVVGVSGVMLGFGGMYLEGQQYGLYSLYIAPLLIIAGFMTVAFSVFRTDPAILREEQHKSGTTGNTTTTASS